MKLLILGGTVFLGEFLDECKAATGSDVRFTWVGDTFVPEDEANFQPWAPDEYIGISTVNCNKAFAAGLTFRSPRETVRDTLAWKTAVLQVTRCVRG
jgi:2'-hydroxyisoflavone reductase